MKLQSTNPHDQSVIGEVEVSSAEDVSRIVKKAKRAFNEWSLRSVEERASFIKTFRQLLVDHKKRIAELITKEMGKPLSQSLGEVEDELVFVDYYLTEGPKILAPEVVLENDNGIFTVTYEPYGVCACIAPWNFPLSMFNSGVLPALIAGNTVVFKPSEHTTFAQKYIGDLLLQTKLPSGVFNYVIGDGSVGKSLVDSEIDLVWFTGSTKVGQEIYSKCADKFIKCLLEMGGSSPAIVFADADVDAVVDILMDARFFNCGQVCSAIKRLFVEQPVFDQVVEKLVDKLKAVEIGDPMQNFDLGPLVSIKQLENLITQVEDAVKKGAKLEIGGQRPVSPELAKGNYYEPTVLTNASLDMQVMAGETFGPVLPVMPFNTEDEAVALANQTPYGLTAEVYTGDKNKALRVARGLQAGTVAINTDSFFYPECPFGGYKMSGLGREYGHLGLQEFCQVKTLAVAK